MKKNNKALLNVISNLTLQICTIISGFIIPKIILVYFGSEVNGLVSSLNQMLNYIALVEGGVTGVITAALYKPLVENNTKSISSIVNTANKFFKKIGFIFIIYSIILSIFYPLIFKTGFSFFYVFSLTIVLSMNLLIQYMFSLTYKTLLIADKKIYIVSISQSIMIILNIVLSIVSVKIYPSIHILKLINGILFLMQPIVFNYYINKNYSLNLEENANRELLKSRWDGFAINVAAFIHSCTDVTILTIFSNLKMVSIYGVYSLVTNGVKSIINSISSAISPIIGHTYASGNQIELNKKLDLYEYIILFSVFTVFTITALLITPFVMIYTKGINDANYYQPVFGYLIVMSEALYLLKFPHLNLAYSANKFKEITKPAFIEALLNIIISIFLVKKYNIIGIMIGTIVAMLYRMIFHINYTKQIIRLRDCNKYYFKLLYFTFGAVAVFVVCNIFIDINIINVASWIMAAFVYGMVAIVIYLIVSYLFFKEELLYLFRYIKKEKN